METGLELYNIASHQKVLSLPSGVCSFSSNGKYFAAWKLGPNVDGKPSRLKVASLPEGEAAIPVWQLNDKNAESIDPLVIGSTTELPTSGSSLQMGNDGKSFLLQNLPDHAPMMVAVFSGGNPEPVLLAHNSVPVTAWSPDGRIIASSTSYNGVQFRLVSDVSEEQMKEILTIPTYGSNSSMIRFSLDGRRLAIGGSQGTIDVWDISDVADAAHRRAVEILDSSEVHVSTAASIPPALEPRLIRTIKASTDGISALGSALNFSPDASLLTSRDLRGNARLWEVESVPGKYHMDRIMDDPYVFLIPVLPSGQGGGIQFRMALDSTKRGVVQGTFEKDERVDAVLIQSKVTGIRSPVGKHGTNSSFLRKGNFPATCD